MASKAWSFFRAGGFDQVRLSSGADVVALDQLDQKLWVALSCPTKGLEFDPRTLELLDTQKDQRIRPPELTAAASWVGGLLKNPDDLQKGASELALNAIRDDAEEGRALVAAARAVLQGLGKPNATSVSVGDVAASVKAFEQLPFNGDGVAIPDAAPDSNVRKLVEEVVACTGGTADRGGKQGISAANVDAFFKDVGAHAAWLDKGQKDAATILPLKDGTAAAAAAVSALAAKVDDFFTRVHLAAFDPRAAAAVNGDDKLYGALAQKTLSASGLEIADFPLARVEAGRALPLKDGVNPAWVEAVTALRDKAVVPLLGERAELTEADWKAMRGKLAPFMAWQGEKAGGSVEKLGSARVHDLTAAGARAPLDDLLKKEAEQAPVAAKLESLERLVHYHRDLMKLANNFVAFRDFYERKSPATFQVGTLYLDQRACDLCLRVDDAGRFGTLAPLSSAYLAFCDCVRPSTGEKMSIVAAFTAGDSDNLMVGRNGVFYDRAGRDWDATITKIVDNPISVQQAFWAPYKKLLRFVEEQVNKRAAAADSAATERLTTGATQVGAAAETGKAPAVEEKKFDVGTIAALGVAVGGITAALSAMLGAFLGLGMFMPVGVLGLMLAISGPSMAIAWLKLRKRNLAPLLDAAGWAINAPARINVAFGNSLTHVAVLPPGSRRDLSDPFADKPRPWGFWAAVLVVVGLALGWFVGKLDGVLPGPVKSTTVMGQYAPAAQQAAPATPAAPAAPAPAP